LKNKIEHLLESKPKKLTKDAKREYKLIDDFLDRINDFLSIKEKQEERQKKYKKVCVKKSKIKYEKEIIELQLELLKLQNHIKETGQKLLIIFE